MIRRRIILPCLEPFTTEGGFCAGDYLSARRINGLTYLVVASEFQTVIFLPEPSGSLKLVCKFKPALKWNSAQKEIANLIHRAYPVSKDGTKLIVQRPDLETVREDLRYEDHRLFARKGEKVWAVEVKCEGFWTDYARFWVHTSRKDILPMGGNLWWCK